MRGLPFHCRLHMAALGCALLSGCLNSSGQKPDPIVQDFIIGYVKRAVPVDNQGAPTQPDVRRQLRANTGGDLYIRNRASISADETNVTFTLTGGQGDVRDLDVSYDGTKLLFSLRLPRIDGLDEDQQPKWNIWEYDVASKSLNRVISSDITAETGHDVAPHYLPDGRIIFSSSRQRTSRALLLDESKPQFSALTENRNEEALVLHVMNADGTNIQQITFNQSHDLDPLVLSNGQIAYTRWENMGSRSQMSVYKSNPDGTELQVLYGEHSHDSGTDDATVQFIQPRLRYDGKLMAILMPFTGTYGGGDIITIDQDNYIDNNQVTLSNQGILSGSGQSSITTTNIRTDTQPSPGGRYSAAYPLWDGSDRLLVSWSPCRVVENELIRPCTAQRLAAANVQEAAPLYGLFIFDVANNTQMPIAVPQENVIFTDIVVAQARTRPPVIFDKSAGAGLDSAMVNENLGAIHIRSVHDFDGGYDALSGAATNIDQLADPAQTLADARPARFLRLVKAVSIPEDVPGTAFGRSSQQLMREILGYALIEPDGSAKLKVPANLAFTIEVLDKNARRITDRHQYWLQLKPGETLECNGCHTHNNGIPHGHPEGPTALHSGSPTGGIPFPNTESTLIAEITETMAETRSRISCLSNCAALNPSVNIAYTDDWTDAAVRAKDAAFAYNYSDLDATFTAPVSAACQTAWTNTCRIVINYVTHIQPIWELSRPGMTYGGNPVDAQCNTCHSPTDNMAQTQVPAAQLDLRGIASTDEPDHVESYRELLFPDNEQELNGATLQDRLVPGVDADGNAILVPVAAPGPYISTDGANSSDFFGIFDAGGTHAGFLSTAELRLISEWVDIGAQYYNNPFDVPAN